MTGRTMTCGNGGFTRPNYGGGMYGGGMYGAGGMYQQYGGNSMYQQSYGGMPAAGSVAAASSQPEKQADITLSDSNSNEGGNTSNDNN